MAIHLADRVTRIKESPSTAATQRVRDLRAEGVEVLSLTVGEPDFDTPDFVKAAAEEAIRSGETKYTSVNGTPALQQAILDRVETRIGLRYSSAELAVGGGGKQVIFLALMATVSDGAEVIIPAPYWVSYPDMVAANDAHPVIVKTRESDGFKLTPATLAATITDRTAWLILNSPGNPTGAVYSRAELEELAAVLRRHPQVNVLSDEIYDEICFEEERAPSLLQVAPDLREKVLLVNGVSKTYAMTGWRIGYGAGPQVLVKAMNKLQSQVSTCASSVSQAAAAAALSGDQSFIGEMTETYRRRRDLVVARINAIPGLSCLRPDGAFYVYVSCAGVLGRSAPDGRQIDSDEALTHYLLDRARVAVVHGAAFGMSPYFRVSFATSEDVLEASLTQIEAALAELR